MITIRHGRLPNFRGYLSVVALTLMLFWTAGAPAQLTTAQLSGVVTDTSGLALAGAEVTAVQQQTGYKQTVKTGTTGQYLFPSLPVGNYNVSVDMAGYSSYVQKGLVLTVGQAATSNVELKVGSVTDQVIVTADALLVTTDSPTVGQLINQQSVASMPLNGRDVQQLVFLIPGATNVSSQNCGANCEGGTFPGEQYAKVRGRRERRFLSAGRCGLQRSLHQRQSPFS